MEEVAATAEPAATVDEEEEQKQGEIIEVRLADVKPQIDQVSDIVFEVMRRLPVESLLRFRSVCSSWRDFIDGDFFSSKYPAPASGAREGMQRRRRPLLFAWGQESRDNTESTTPSDYRRVYVGRRNYNDETASSVGMHPLPGGDMEIKTNGDYPGVCRLAATPCGGLNLMYSDTVIRILHIPSRQILTLPESEFLVKYQPLCGYPVTSTSLGYDARSKKYRVVRMVRRIRDSGLIAGCEVYSFGVDARWRGLGREIMEPYSIDFHVEPVSFRGIHYWLSEEDAIGRRRIVTVEVKESESGCTIGRMNLMEHNPKQYRHLKLLLALQLYSENDDTADDSNFQICVMGELYEHQMVELWMLGNPYDGVNRGNYHWSRIWRIGFDSWSGLCWRGSLLAFADSFCCYRFIPCLSHMIKGDGHSSNCVFRRDGRLWWCEITAKVRKEIPVVLPSSSSSVTALLGAALYKDSLFGMGALRREKILIDRLAAENQGGDRRQ